MKNLAIAVIASLVVIAATGCAATRGYDGPPRSREQVAVITGIDDAGITVLVRKVDGKVVQNFRKASSEIEVLPGRHEIETSCWMKGIRGSEGIKNSIDAQAGADYQILIVVMDGKCSTSIINKQK